MFGYIKDKFVQWQYMRTPLARVLRGHTENYFYGRTSLSGFTREGKARLISALDRRIAQILRAPNPVMACREALAEYTLGFARLQVHCLTESEKAEQFYSDNPYISGELWRHIRKASDHHEELLQIKQEHADLSDGDLIAAANTRSALGLYYANALNLMRITFGDRNEQRDWFRPFVEACLVNEEHHLRLRLRLPVLLPSSSLEGYVYAGFLSYVVKGEPDPFFAWMRDFPGHYLAGNGPVPDLTAHRMATRPTSARYQSKEQ